MGTTTIYRVLTKTDLGKSGFHGGVIIPDDPAKEAALQNFFEGTNVDQSFIDVRHPDGKKYKLRYANYKANGKTPNDRLVPIISYATANDLCPGDTLILEKIDNGTEKTYLIDYARKISELVLVGKKKATRTQTAKAEITNTTIFDAIINEQINSGTVRNPYPNKYEIDNVNNNGTIGDLSLDRNGESVDIDFTVGRDIIKGRETKRLTFDGGNITFETVNNPFEIVYDQPILNNRYGNRIYEEEDASIAQNTRPSDFNSVPGTYTASPESKESAKTQNGRKIYPRKKSKSLNALKRANYTCECNAMHPTFERKGTNIPYTEPHHLIPLHYYEDFSNSLDVEANIVSLCSNCHNQVHYGDGSTILSQLLAQRQAELSAAGIDADVNGNLIDVNKLLSYYKL